MFSRLLWTDQYINVTPLTIHSILSWSLHNTRTALPELVRLFQQQLLHERKKKKVELYTHTTVMILQQDLTSSMKIQLFFLIMSQNHFQACHSQSSTLNPTEMVSGELDHRVKVKQPRTAQEVQEFFQREPPGNALMLLVVKWWVCNIILACLTCFYDINQKISQTLFPSMGKNKNMEKHYQSKC